MEDEVVHAACENHELRSSRDSQPDSRQECFSFAGVSLVDCAGCPSSQEITPSHCMDDVLRIRNQQVVGSGRGSLPILKHLGLSS
jgi:hypothetical protein